jgi:hypothetical protein
VTAGLVAPCYAGACVELGGELWLAGQVRLALGVPLRATLAIGADAEAVDAVALGNVSIEAGWRVPFGKGRASWAAFELGGAVPTASDDADVLDVQRFAFAPTRFGADRSTVWFDGAVGYGVGGEFAVARIGLLQDLSEIPVSNDGVEDIATRLRLGIGGGAEIAPAWEFEAGALAIVDLASSADYLLFADDDDNLYGDAAYQVQVGLRGRGERSDLAFTLRVPFWQSRERGPADAPQPGAETRFFVFLEATGRFWF